MARPLSLNPVDVAVALGLVAQPEATYEQLSMCLGVSNSTAHDAVARLRVAGLVHLDERRVNRHALMEFIAYGVRYAFPPQWQGQAQGVPTAYAAPPLSERILAAVPAVWADDSGDTVGEALVPLYSRAPELPRRCREVYELLSLVDAIRAGRAREKNLAMRELRARFGVRERAFAA